MMVAGFPLRVMVCPTAPGSRLKRRAQNRSVSTMRWAPPIRFSGAVKRRPRIGFRPRTSKNCGSTAWASTGSGSPVPVRSNFQARAKRPIDSKARDSARQSSPSGSETSPSRVMKARRSGAAKGSGRRRIPSTRLNMAVVAPIPNVSVRSAAAANPGLRASQRAVCLRSSQRCCKGRLPAAPDSARCSRTMVRQRSARSPARKKIRPGSGRGSIQRARNTASTSAPKSVRNDSGNHATSRRARRPVALVIRRCPGGASRPGVPHPPPWPAESSRRRADGDRWW